MNFFSAPKSLKAVNIRLDEMEEFRAIAMS